MFPVDATSAVTVHDELQRLVEVAVAAIAMPQTPPHQSQDARPPSDSPPPQSPLETETAAGGTTLGRSA